MSEWPSSCNAFAIARFLVELFFARCFRFVTKHAFDGRTDRQNFDSKVRSNEVRCAQKLLMRGWCKSWNCRYEYVLRWTPSWLEVIKFGLHLTLTFDPESWNLGRSFVLPSDTVYCSMFRNDDFSHSATAEIARVGGRYADQGHSRLLMLVPIESPYATAH